MEHERALCRSLVDKLRDAFMELDSDIMMRLHEESAEYRELFAQASAILSGNSQLCAIIDQGVPAALSEQDARALIEYINSKREYEDVERLELYIRGHMDCIAYLEKMGVLCSSVSVNAETNSIT